MKQDWNHKKLTDLCAIQYGFAFDSSYFNDSGDGLPLIRIRDVVRGFSETYYSGAYPPEYIVKKGDYLIGMDGEFNIAQWKGGEALLNQRVCKISSKSDSYIEQFAYYFLCRILKEIEDETPFVTVKHLSAKRLNQILTPVPSIEEQKAICSLLDKMNRVIEAKKEQLKELDNLAQAIFYDMFGDPVTNEKGWSIDRLEANCEVSSAKRVLVEDVVESGIPFLRGTELTALSKSVSSKNVTFTMFITPEHYERVKAVTGVPKKGDILIPSINSEGIAWVVDTDEPFYFKDGRVIWVHVNTSVFVSQYLSSAITRILKTNYSLLTSGATFLELKLFIIRDLPTPIPPLPLQQAFAEKVEAIERQKELINQSIREVQTLFDSRMDYWFSEEDDDFGQLDKLN